MSIRANKFPIPELIVPRHVLASVFDKNGLDVLVNGMLEVNPEATFYSTGGTEKAIRIILERAGMGNYISVEQFTGAPEMEGGLVKTLHPKIHAGLLGERGNPEHERYLREEMAKMGKGPGVYFDVLACNFYPFSEVIAREGVTPEQARTHIDIGGPAMVRAAAKNWHSVAVLSSPQHYEEFVQNMRENREITAEDRFKLMQDAFTMVGGYDAGIDNYFMGLNFERDVKSELTWEGESNG